MFVIPYDMHILACMSNITNCFAPKNGMSCCGLRVRMHAKKMNVTKPYFTIHEWSIKFTIKLSNSEKIRKYTNMYKTKGLDTRNIIQHINAGV